MTIDIETPELDKMLKVTDESQPIGEFLEWLSSRYEVCQFDEDYERYYPVSLDIEKLLAEYYDIDMDKIEVERRALLDAMRESY